MKAFCCLVHTTDRCSQGEKNVSSDDVSGIGCGESSRIRIYTYSLMSDGEWRNDPALLYTSGNLCVIGRIVLWNEGELKRLLGAENEPVASQTLSNDLICRAFRKWGRDFVAKLDGVFSFVLIDIAQESIIAASDQFGSERLYFSATRQRSGQFVFSNLLSGIRFLSQTPTPLNSSYLFHYLSFLEPDRFATAYTGVSLLPPAHSWTLCKSTITMTQYWSMLAKESQGSICSVPVVAQLRRLLQTSVAIRLARCRKPAILLSGGLDSSAVFAYSTKVLQEKGQNLSDLLAVCRVFQDDFRDSLREDQKYAEEIASFYHLPLQVSDEEVTKPLSCLPQYYQKMGTFPYNPISAILLPTLRIARSFGAREVLTGFGGDEIVSMQGTDILPLLLRNGQFLDFWQTLKGLHEHYSLSYWQYIRALFIKPLTPNWSVQLYRHLHNKKASQERALSFVHPDLNKQHAGDLHAKDNLHSEQVLPPDKAIEGAVFSGIFHHCGEYYTYCRIAEDVECIHPLLNTALAEFMAKLPLAEYLQGGWRRSMLRRAVSGLVPESICHRKDKSPFSLPNQYYIQEEREMILDMLHSPNSLAWDYLDKNTMLKWLDRICFEENTLVDTDLTGTKMGMAMNIALFAEHSKKVQHEGSNSEARQARIQEESA